MISMIENNCVERKKWITHDECNCFGVIHAWKMNFRAGIITVILVAVMAGYKKLEKKKLSPILLIVIAAAAGVVVYGI